MPQRPIVPQPAFQPEALYAAPLPGKLVVELGAIVSTVHVYCAGEASVFPAASVARTLKVWLPSERLA